jgi:hypothetical protein
MEEKRPPLRTNPMRGWDDEMHIENLEYIRTLGVQFDEEQEKKDLARLKKDVKKFAQKQGLESFFFSCPHVQGKLGANFTATKILFFYHKLKS